NRSVIEMKKVISDDLGASNGRVILVKLTKNKLLLEELHRFKNEAVKKDTHLFCDISYIFQEIKAGLQKYTEMYKDSLDGIGIDTWGVDFGFVSFENELLEDPYSYRDTHTNKIMSEVHEKV